MTLSTPALALTLALALGGCQKAEDAAFGQKVRGYLLEHPEVLQEVADKLREKEKLAALKASAGAIQKHRAQLERDPRDFVANPRGKVTVVEFFDYRCGYCKTTAPEVVKLIQDNPDVRFVFKELPIFGEVSDTAARIAVSGPAKAKGLELYSRWMGEQALNDASVDRHLAAVGIDPAAARAAARSPAVSQHIADVRQLASALSIEGTPAFIVGDIMIPGADIAALKAAIIVAKAGDLKRPG
ncbi:DsbA family protein [Phenylobacterium sp.]|uniref:DsbA family protein n=1 Tax=Phenylobacterium sp. TaxID=1871053 RepID=UPI0039839344